MSILDLQTMELPQDDAAPIDDTLASVNSTLSVLNCTNSTVSTIACL
ncbi:SapB/AmfS family lanthipeptide [Streptacidiphilus anmyonensis]|nr:SapB/AmfS family lanthipeptide [Streptacidiphilus anmyonensis]